MRHPIATAGTIVWIGMLAVGFFSFQPLLVGGFVTQLQFSEAQAGLVVTSNLLGVTLSLIVFSLGRRPWNKRTLMIVALLLAGIGNLLSVFTDTFHGMLVVRLVAGLGDGLLKAVATSSIVLFRKPERLYALIMITASLYGMAGMNILPHVFELYGLASVFVVMAALALLSLPLSGLLPETKADCTHHKAGIFSLSLRPQVLLLLLSVMLVSVAVNGVWSYYERMGIGIGLSPEDIGFALSLGLFSSLMGGVLAAALSGFSGRLIAITVSLILGVIAMVNLYYASSFSAYTVSIMLIWGFTGFVLPFYMGTVAALDASGRLPVVAYLSGNFGNVVGPAFAAAVVTPGYYANYIVIAGMLLVVAVVLVWISHRRGAANSPALIPQG